MAITTSPIEVRPSPPPKAAPSTTSTMVCGRLSKRARKAPKRRFCTAIASFSPGAGNGVSNCAMKPRMSPPAQKVPPAPRSTTVAMSLALSRNSTTLSSSSTISPLSAFFVSGRFKVM